MCKKLPYCSRKIDPCIKGEVIKINSNCYGGGFKTLASCCGHGKYPKTIVVKDNATGQFFEWFTETLLVNRYKNGKVRKRFYLKDTDGYYFLPEIMKKEMEKKKE